MHTQIKIVHENKNNEDEFGNSIIISVPKKSSIEKVIFDNFSKFSFLTDGAESMIANFEEGILDGWCIYLGNEKDDFWGMLKFEDGEVVDSEEFGFASEEEKTFIESVTKNLDNKTENLSDDIVEKVESVYKLNVD